jgi:hypothetical protein
LLQTPHEMVPGGERRGIHTGPHRSARAVASWHHMWSSLAPER